MVTRRRQPAGNSVMVGKIWMSSRVTWPGTTGCAATAGQGMDRQQREPVPDVVHVCVLSSARFDPSNAPEDMGRLSPVGDTASTVAASSVSVVFDVMYTVASIGPATTSGR